MPKHTVPTAHLVAVAKPQVGKYAPCARADCACSQEGGSSWDGKAGMFCCRACRNGTPCTKLWHTVPLSVATAHAQARYTGNECALEGCAKPPWNGRPGEYCSQEHRRLGRCCEPTSEAVVKALAVSEGVFPNYDELWARAAKWARTCGVGAVKGNVSAVWLNESLTCTHCPARLGFEKAVQRAKVKSWEQGEFGWHGTRSMSGVTAICWGNWDTQRRSGQACGPGEYFSRGTTGGLHYSEGYAGGDAAQLLLVAWIVSSKHGAKPSCPEQNGATYPGAMGHIVCNNPVGRGNKSTGEMYCVPIAVVAFGTGGSKPSFRVQR